MPESEQNDNKEIVRERAHMSNRTTILILPDIIRAYHVMGLLSDGEFDELNNMSNDNAKLTFLKNKIPGMAPEQKLEFCEAFVGDDLTNFHNATPAIMAGAYRAAFAKAKDNPDQKERLRKIAARIDEMSADFANSGGMIINDKVIDTTNVVDVYAGFADMLRARMGDVDKMDGADKAEKIETRKQEMSEFGVPLSEAQITRINNNLGILDSMVEQYDDQWGLADITADNVSKLENRWDKLDYRLARARVYPETIEIMAKYKFLDKDGKEIPQFNRNGRKVVNDSRLYMIQELARHNVEKRHVGRIGEKIDVDALEDEFNDEILFLLWNMKTQGQNIETAIDDPEIFLDYTKRNKILNGMAQEGGEISDRAYRGMLFAHENATAGWLARIKTKAGDAVQKDDMWRFYDKAGVINGADARMQERMRQIIRILKGCASAFVASTIITSVATAAAVVAGLSPAAGIALVGIITAIGLGFRQFHRWKKHWVANQIATGKPHDRAAMRQAFFADKSLLASFGVSTVAIAAMIFGAAGLTQAAMIAGYGALALGGLKNGREAYFAARKRMSAAESLVWAIANAGAIAGGGFAGRAVGHELVDWVNGRWSDNTFFQKEVATSHEHSITGDVEHSKTIINYPDGMIDRAETAVRNWYATQYPNNPDVLQQHIDAVNQYNADFGTNLDPWVTLRAMALCDGLGGYSAPGWMHQYGYTPDQIAAGANAITADGYNPDGMARLIDLQMNHLDEFGHIGLVDRHVLRPNDLYSDIKHTPKQQTLSYTEPKTVVRDIPGVAHVPVHTPGMMAAYGTYDPWEESAPRAERVGSVPKERPLAKKWKNLHEQLGNVIAARGKKTNPSLADKLRTKHADIQASIKERIAQWRNKFDHVPDAEIEQVAETDAERKEQGTTQENIANVPEEKGIIFAPVGDGISSNVVQEPRVEVAPEPEREIVPESEAEVVPGATGVSIGDIIAKQEEHVEPEVNSDPTPEPIVVEPEPVNHVQEESKPRADTLQGAWLAAQGKKIAGAHDGHIYEEPLALKRLAEQENLTTTLNKAGKSIPKDIGTYNGLPFHLVDINGNGNPLANSPDGPVVIVNWQDIRIPFVLATGMNLDDHPDNPVTPGKWYPVSMVCSNGRFYNPEHTNAHIAYETGEYQNASEREYGRLMEIAKYLDTIIGDVRNWKDAQRPNVGGCDVIPSVNMDDVLHEIGKSSYEYDDVEYMVYSPSPEHASRAAGVMNRALIGMEDPDWHKANYNMFGELRRGVSRVGDVTGNIAQTAVNVAQKVRNFFGWGGGHVKE